ncbi:hypothetical protein LY632_13395 [Erythrobacter sp. SDW2]|uniref:hypothetical protein n=1 Tax=Erythrobacter sp. SDW2 TaxID=2907154 RepID=UPI001F40278F|nr:hypothetical protein [Erythrobacter sp. SDW2]UIP06662.1 hypothetical protein LY632_13395 [Erythrobacter sp. SDW2]
MMLRPVSVLAATLALAACGSDKAPVAAEGANAQGEILGGTISDAMLPLDELESESPPMKAAAGEGGAASNGTAKDDSADEATDDSRDAEPAEPAEAAEPAEES